MLESFRLGGWGMWLTLICGVPLIYTSVRYARRPERRWVPLILSLGILTLCSGGLGFTSGLITSLSVLQRVPADERYITLIGLGESLHNVAFALLLVVPAAIAASIGTWKLSQSTDRLASAT
jgi:ABC-type Fe3+ transport system permease subunit